MTCFKVLTIKLSLQCKVFNQKKRKTSSVSYFMLLIDDIEKIIEKEIRFISENNPFLLFISSLLNNSRVNYPKVNIIFTLQKYNIEV